MPTEHNSPIYKDSRPTLDAGPVSILRSAGALIYGKTYTTEFATITVGTPARNPFDPRRTPGGSSSGSGAAVADWQCHVAFGTQTGGSTIRPGSYNGVFAMKPTWGAITREGLKICSLTLDTLGLFARSIADIQLMCKIFNIQDDIPTSLPYKPLDQCTFAYVKTDQWEAKEGPSPELVRAWSLSRQLLEKAGAKCVEVNLSKEFNGVMGEGGKHSYIFHGEAGVSFLPEYLRDKDNLHEEIQEHVENRKTVSKKKQLKAYDEIAALRPKIDEIAGAYDAIITPSVPSEAWMGIEKTGDARFCGMWTALHVPCVNIPGFASENGCPIGLTLLGPRYEDERLLGVASRVAEAWVDADNDKLNKLPAPKGAKHCIA